MTNIDETMERYIPKKTTIRSGKEIELIIPKTGDYMVSTLSHYNSLKNGGYKLNGDVPPHYRMNVMYLGEHGLSQCSWGCPAVMNGREIHSVWPGEWELGLVPSSNNDNKKEEKKNFDTLISF